MRVNASGCVSDEARLNRSHVRTCADAAIARTMEKGGVAGLATGQRKQESESPPGFLTESEDENQEGV